MYTDMQRILIYLMVKGWIQLKNSDSSLAEIFRISYWSIESAIYLASIWEL